MPARSRQALQHRPRRRLFVKMHWLRIELAGKRKDFLARHAARSERPEMAGRKIFEGQRHGGDCCKGGPIVPLFVAISTRRLAWLVLYRRLPRAFPARPRLARDDIRS